MVVSGDDMRRSAAYLRELLVILVIFGFAVLCYASVIPAYFLSDDFTLIGETIRRGMFYTWVSQSAGYLRPGTILSYVVDHQVWGLNPTGYHLTNILFHGLSAYALFLISRHYFRKLLSAEPTLVSCFVACVFVALPCHSESVSWIAGRTDVIAIALGLTATAFFLFLFEDRSPLWGLLSAVLLAAALFTKESVIILPLIWCGIVLQAWWLRKDYPPVASLITLLVSFILLGGYFFLRREIFGNFTGAQGAALHHLLSKLPITSADHLYRFIVHTFLPTLPFRLYTMSQQPLAFWATGFAAGIVASVFIVHRRWFRAVNWSFVILLGVCYLVSVLPVLTMELNLFESQGERVLYLPSTFACLLLVYFAATCIPQARYQSFALLILIVFESISLQWVNQRWITASQLSEQIASEVSKTDPASTLVLNVPDNFRGAYVFRNGLDEAATIFMRQETRVPYRVMVLHDVNSIDELFEVGSDSTSVVLALPENIRYHVREYGFLVEKGEWSIAVADSPGAHPEILSFLSFTTAAGKPMLRTIRWMGTKLKLSAQ
jgi:hypothetical protein